MQCERVYSVYNGLRLNEIFMFTFILALDSLIIFLMLDPLLPMTAPTAVSGIYKNAVSISSCGGGNISGPWG